MTRMQQLTCVDKGVGVLLEEQVLQHAALGHQAEQVVVAAKEDVQPAAGVRYLSRAARQPQGEWQPADNQREAAQQPPGSALCLSLCPSCVQQPSTYEAY